MAFAGLCVPSEMFAGEGVILAFGLIPDRHMGFNPFLVDHLAQHRRRSVAAILSEASLSHECSLASLTS